MLLGARFALQLSPQHSELSPLFLHLTPDARRLLAAPTCPVEVLTKSEAFKAQGDV